MDKRMRNGYVLDDRTNHPRVWVIKDFYDNAELIEKLLAKHSIIYEKDILGTALGELMVVLYDYYRFECTDYEYDEIVHELRKIEYSDDFLVIEAGAISGEVMLRRK